MIISIFFPGFVFSNKVSQSPLNVFRSEGDDAELECQHSISSYNVMLWYKQTIDHGLTLLGYLFMQTDQKESDFLNKIHLKGDATKKGSLVIKNLSGNDSAVYFCAASLHNDIDKQNLNTKSALQSVNTCITSRSVWVSFEDITDAFDSFLQINLLSMKMRMYSLKHLPHRNAML